jgi:hypothetical protein
MQFETNGDASADTRPCWSTGPFISVEAGEFPGWAGSIPGWQTGAGCSDLYIGRKAAKINRWRADPP